MIDEPLVVPLSPGDALLRLTQVAGALERHPHLAQALPAETVGQLYHDRDALLQAIGADEHSAVESALRGAQNRLRDLYEAARRPSLWSEEQAKTVFRALHFPDPLNRTVQAADAASVIATYSCPQRQVLTALSFEHAPGAVGYWLREIRLIAGEEVEDHLVESDGPVFRRVRLSVGPHRLRIESRDASHIALSDEFQIEVPNVCS